MSVEERPQAVMKQAEPRLGAAKGLGAGAERAYASGRGSVVREQSAPAHFEGTKGSLPVTSYHTEPCPSVTSLTATMLLVSVDSIAVLLGLD